MAKNKKQLSRSKKPPKKDFGRMNSMPLTRVRGLLKAVQSTSVENEPPQVGKEDKFLSVLATNAWRMKQRMLDVETGEAKEEYKRVYRYVERFFEALTDFGVEVKEHTGQKYADGSGLKVIASEKRSDLKAPEIIETMLPTVRFEKRFLQIGEVIVGVPE